MAFLGNLRVKKVQATLADALTNAARPFAFQQERVSAR
jgi:hypothetical protein